MVENKNKGAYTVMHTIPNAEKQIAQRAFAEMVKQADTLGLLFYARLFELDPTLRELFHTDLDEQAHSLITMLRLCIEGLDERTELLFALRNLGARHVEYGVKERDYETVHEALLWTMHKGLGDRWNAETERALNLVLSFFIYEMLRGTVPEGAPEVE